MIEITDDNWYHLRVNDDDIVFNEQQNAVEYLRTRKSDIDLTNPLVELVLVDVGGDEWTIEPVSWKNITLELL